MQQHETQNIREVGDSTNLSNILSVILKSVKNIDKSNMVLYIFMFCVFLIYFEMGKLIISEKFICGLRLTRSTAKRSIGDEKRFAISRDYRVCSDLD